MTLELGTLQYVIAAQTTELQKAAKYIQQVEKQVKDLSKTKAQLEVNTTALKQAQKEIQRLNKNQVKLEVKAQGVKQAQEEVKRLDNQFKALKSSGVDAGQAINEQFNQIKATIAGAITVTAAWSIVKQADEFNMLEARIKDASSSLQEFKANREALLDISGTTGMDLGGTVSLFQTLNDSAADLGKSREQIVAFTETTAQLAAIGGKSTAEISGAMTQLGQALGSPIVRAEEFNSVMEGMRPLAQLAADNIKGVDGSVSKLRQMMLDGSLSSKVFFDAVVKGTQETQKRFDALPPSVSRSMGMLNISWLQYIDRVNEAIEGTSSIANVIQFLAGNIGNTIGVLGTLAAAFTGVKLGVFIAGIYSSISAVGGLSGAFGVLTAAIMANPLGFLIGLVAAATTAYITWGDEIKAFLGIMDEQKTVIAEIEKAHKTAQAAIERVEAATGSATKASRIYTEQSRQEELQNIATAKSAILRQQATASMNASFASTMAQDAQKKAALITGNSRGEVAQKSDLIRQAKTFAIEMQSQAQVYQDAGQKIQELESAASKLKKLKLGGGGGGGGVGTPKVGGAKKDNSQAEAERAAQERIRMTQELAQMQADLMQNEFDKQVAMEQIANQKRLEQIAEFNARNIGSQQQRQALLEANQIAHNAKLTEIEQARNEHAQAIVQQYQQALTNTMTDGLEKQLSLENLAYQERLTALENFKNEKILTEQELQTLSEAELSAHYERIKKIEEEAKQNAIDKERAEIAARQKTTVAKLADIAGFHEAAGHLSQQEMVNFGETLDTQMQTFSQHSKKMFALYKAYSVAKAIIDGVAATIAAYKFGNQIGGPILGAVFAATAAATTGAQVAAITSAQFQGGRKEGGFVSPNSSYRVNEGGKPELLSVGNQDYLMMGSQGGFVTSNKDLQSSSNNNLFNPSIVAPQQQKVMIVIKNEAAGFEFEQRQISESEIEIIAKRVVARDTPKLMQREMNNPNSRSAAAFTKNYQTQRKR